MDWVLFGFFKAMIALGHTKETLTAIGYIRSSSDETSWKSARFSASLDAGLAEGYYPAELRVSAPMSPELLARIDNWIQELDFN